MTNFSSLTEELSQEEFQAQIVVDTENYIVLRPTAVGFSGTSHVVKVEGPQKAPLPMPKREENQSFGSFQRAMDAYYRSFHPERMMLWCDQESVARFQRVPNYEHFVPKRITKEYNFKEIAEWVHTQTKGGWSVCLYVDKDNRPSKSFLVFYFEQKEAAALFKLFNI